MTDLVQVIWECHDLKGMDRVVMMGWAERLEDDNDTVYASKQTVADYLGVSLDTIKRRTHALVKAGWLVDTGERKQWEPDCWTPVYRINLEKFEAWDFGGANCTGGAKKAGVQIAPQGSGSGSALRSAAGAAAVSPSTSHTTGLRPEVVKSAPPTASQNRENQNPRTNGRTNPNSRSCPKCGGAWSRDKNHICVASRMDKPLVPKPDPDFDDDFMDMPPNLNRDCMREKMHFEDGDYDGTPLFTKERKPEGEAMASIPCKGKDKGYCEGRMVPELWNNSDGWCVECMEHGHGSG
jgi:hypothetical protein